MKALKASSKSDNDQFCQRKIALYLTDKETANQWRPPCFQILSGVSDSEAVDGDQCESRLQSGLGSKLNFEQIKTTSIIKYLPSSRSISSLIWIETLTMASTCIFWLIHFCDAGGALSGQIESKIGGQRNDIPDKTSKMCSTKMFLYQAFEGISRESGSISLTTYNYFRSPPTTFLLYQNNLKEKLFRSLALNATDGTRESWWSWTFHRRKDTSMRRRYLWPSYDIWPQQTRAVCILSNLLAWLPDCYLPWHYTGKTNVLHANYSFRPATRNHRERRDVRIHFHPLLVVRVQSMVSKKWSVLQRDHMAFGCLRPCRVPWDALIYKR